MLLRRLRSAIPWTICLSKQSADFPAVLNPLALYFSGRRKKDSFLTKFAQGRYDE